MQGGESRAAALAACVTGRCMPISGSDIDFFRVLYGMLATECSEDIGGDVEVGDATVSFLLW